MVQGIQLNRFYDWIERVWIWIAERLFVRFQFDLPVEQLREQIEKGRLIFAMVDGGFFDWLLLSSWCRSHGLGAVEVANRRRILLLSQPSYFVRVLFGRSGFADLFLNEKKRPRLLCLQGKERKRINVPTPTESLLSEIYARAGASGELGGLTVVPVFIVWRRHMRGGSRQLSEYLLGLSSRPNTFGKIWYLMRRRTDSHVKALSPLPFATRERLERVEGFDENESMRLAKSLRRKILVSVQQEMRVLLGPRYHSPSLIKETVLRDPEVQAVVTKVAEAEGIDRRKILTRAYQDLTEIAADYRFRMIEVVYVLLRWAFAKVFDGMNAKDEQWQKVRELMKTKPVVFIPCHRSHFDYLVIPYLLFLNDMVTPHIAAGINLAFWPVGRFLRMAGAFFIRRSFRGDLLYQTVLVKYVHTLLSHRYNVKFFIEGTRSRSGKMLAPAYGMLKMVMETYPNRVCEDVALIPVSICYDEIPEQGSYTRELGGGTKVKENAVELVRSLNVLQRKLGKVYVRCGPALSLKDMYSDPEEDSKRRLQKAAFQICKSICDATPIIPKSLVSTVFLCHRNPLLTLEEVLRLSSNLAAYVRHAGMELSVENEEALRRALEQTVRRLRKSGTLLEIENVPRRYVCDSRKRPLLNFYKNSAIHCTSLPAIALLSYYQAWQKHGDGESHFVDRFQKRALELRDILKFEFFFNPRQEFLAELQHCASFFFGANAMQTADPEVWGAHLAKVFPVASDASVFSRVLGELLESYLCFADYVRAMPENTWEKKALLTKAMKFAHGRQQQGDVLFPESISTVNFGNALLYLENQKIVAIEKDGDKTRVKRIAEGPALDALVTQLGDYRDLIQEREETYRGL
ncbi:1-acyl-sn-glycerol-3-phosphate acyltransferase [bacterium]|nr:1-acyl-sn-glycerol-3-phosphate acyltransferase [bacterium]